MGFVEAVRAVLSNYAGFAGRASRSEFWWFALFYLLVQLACGVLDAVLFSSYGGGPIGALVSLALLLPYLAVSVRRLHDIDRSGWWLLISLVPLVGMIVLLVFFVQRGTPGPNRFGADPLPALTDRTFVS